MREFASAGAEELQKIKGERLALITVNGFRNALDRVGSIIAKPSFIWVVEHTVCVHVLSSIHSTLRYTKPQRRRSQAPPFRYTQSLKDAALKLHHSAAASV
jgi:hypothetical protein